MAQKYVYLKPSLTVGYLNICLEVVSLDGAEHLPEGPGLDDVVHELHRQLPAQLHHLRGRPEPFKGYNEH